MCGIIGVTGSTSPVEILLAGLSALEYRGYDSAGLAIVDRGDDSLWRLRAAERARSLEKLAVAIDQAPSNAGASIGHTRWATHGAPTEENAHPHEDCQGRIAVVHNGIIENHRALAAELVRAGHHLASETDTEVVAHLVEEEMAGGASLFDALRLVIPRLHGDFALALVSAADPDALVAARRTSPLVIGMTGSLGLVGSDIAALLGKTRELFLLDDDEIAEVRPGSMHVTDLEGTPVDPRPLAISWDVAAAQKDGYPDFMSKEIREQPGAVRETLLGRIEINGSTQIEELEIDPTRLSEIDRVVLIGCGSSYHTSLVGRQALESWARLSAEADIASEFRYRDSVLTERTLVIAVSQSGETIDTLHAMREAHRRGAITIAMTNVVDSVMARESDGVLYTHAGPEIGVAGTKCTLAQIALLEAFALHLARARGAIDDATSAQVAAMLAGIPDAISESLARIGDYETVGRRYAGAEHFYFLGRRLGLPIALEGALKLKELAYVHAEAYPAGELKHGPIALIDSTSVVVAIATRRSPLVDKVLANIEEVRARGAQVVVVCEEHDEEIAAFGDAVLYVPAVAELAAPLVDIVPLQCFAYAIARERGNDVDRPRNLAKVVTVE